MSENQPIPFIDLKRQQELIKPKLDQRMAAVLKHGRYIMGPEIGELEQKLSGYLGIKHSITLSSGTDALTVAMMALDVGPGDEVITTPFSFFSTVGTILNLGAKPVFVDIDPDTYNIDPEKIEPAITSKTKVILAVSLYGQCADYDQMNKIAQKHGLPVIEDAAQSLGATYKKRKSGALTTIGCTSFFPSKPLGCYGDGGASFTDDDQLAEKMRQIRVHGQSKRYVHSRLGLNARMDTLQAAVLLAKLDIFEREVELREKIGLLYNQKLSGSVKTPEVANGNTHVFGQYTIEVDRRSEIQLSLKEKGIPTAVHYPVPIHVQPALKSQGWEEGDFPVAEAAAKRVMSLPMGPYLTGDDQDRVVAEVKRLVDAGTQSLPRDLERSTPILES